jgi:hypothetical protein
MNHHRPSRRRCHAFLLVLAFAACVLLPDVHGEGSAPAKVVVPGVGSAPPSDAIVLFDGKDLSKWKGAKGQPAWRVEDGVVTVVPGTGELTTKESFGDIQLHLEWRVPKDVSGSDESRGNSGIKLHEAYEIQILDSYQNASNPKTAAGAVYKQHAPLANVCRKPGEWQSFDIIFRAPRFDGQGKLKKAGTFTVFHNGVLIQDKVKILGRTNSTQPVKPELKQPFFLQDHGSAVSYRNIWLRELEPETDGAE